MNPDCERCGAENADHKSTSLGDHWLCRSCANEWSDEIVGARERFMREIRACYHCGQLYRPKGPAVPSSVGGRGCVDCHSAGRGA